ncbi:succinate dehydrogenase, cytochrome b556 subunit [Palleronia sp.]|uniref:succinate dehydrogenase, cytochrome b556 subunit n=1 Tax=Palleronia sp. TaxID=1940284 RepID=UPI0035C84C3D
MADVNRGNRPLSPFMLGKYYRFQLNSVTSIMTRVTGNALVVGGLLVTWWLLAAASGPDAFATADAVLTSWFGDLVMFLSLWALWYHALAGLRHLYWDTGRGFSLSEVRILGWGVIIGSVVLTILTALII